MFQTYENQKIIYDALDACNRLTQGCFTYVKAGEQLQVLHVPLLVQLYQYMILQLIGGINAKHKFRETVI